MVSAAETLRCAGEARQRPRQRRRRLWLVAVQLIPAAHERAPE